MAWKPKRKPTGMTGGKPRRKTGEVTKLKKQLWELCRQITATRYPNTCYTCGATDLTGSNRHLGHAVASSVGGIALRFHLDNLRWQCAKCNIWNSGNSAAFIKNLIDELGMERVYAMLELKKTITQSGKYWYEQKIVEYEKILAESMLG